MVTTGLDTRWPFDVAIADFAAAGLNRASYMRIKLMTVPLEFLHKRLGRLGRKDLSNLRAALQKAIDD
jgi:hypothetical protein